MTHFLVTGASGLLGLNFALQVADQHRITGVVNHNALQGVPFETVQADLSVDGILPGLLDRTEPDVVLHCAAMANVDACESQPEQAHRVNAELPGVLAGKCRRRGIQFVHISTDAVFDGQRGGYSETDAANPINIYSATKLAGEQMVAEANPEAIVARVNFYGYSLFGRRSLGEFFVNSLAAGEQVMGFTDVFFCPLQVNLLSDVLLKMIDKKLSGLYHVLSPESLSKYDFACRIARAFGFDETLITPVSWQEAGLKANRSPNLTLRVDKLLKDLAEPLPDQQEGIQRLFELYQNGYPQKVRSYASIG